jgi:hypothetical protein
MKLPIQNFLIGFVAALLANAVSAADNRIDVSVIINKAEAESVLGTKVKDPLPQNAQGGDGYYSKCTYYSLAPGKTLLLRVYQAAPGHDGRQELEMLAKDTTATKPVAGLGDKALVTSGKESGLPPRVLLLYVTKGSSMIKVGLSGLEDDDMTLKKAKSVAQKILTKL